MKRTVFVWKESVYNNDFTCKCGAKIADDDGRPTENVGMNPEEKYDIRLFCMKCRDLIGVMKEVDVDDDASKGKLGEYDEEKYGGLTEIKAYAFGVGNFRLFDRKSVKWFTNLLKKQKGFLGINPQYPDGNILIFDTLNNAKGARNILRSEGVICGKEIGEVFVDVRFLMGRGK